MIGSYWELNFGEQHNDKKAMDSRIECHVAGELDCSEAHIRLRELDKSEDKDEQANGRSADCEERDKCEKTDSRAMGIIVPWYRRGRTSVELLIPCSYEGTVFGHERGRRDGEYIGKLQVP
ncbi:hypothetical protein B296_00049140 [Ensete ventricosum]|uniref:Uncharacterized protein n=1 Tax=Ensete ventricosum TaxID=4639 RepID=A0A426YH58_ENSVE|nr:hypothetical protein B296_00049140 [Ensete ventricosum]